MMLSICLFVRLLVRLFVCRLKCCGRALAATTGVLYVSSPWKTIPLVKFMLAAAAVTCTSVL